jgi:hypothetical protein
MFFIKPGYKASLVRENLEDDASDDDGLLSQEKDARRPSLNSQRHWVLLFINSFVLLLNIGGWLMVTTPTSCKLDDSNAIRLPHAGEYET